VAKLFARETVAPLPDTIKSCHFRFVFWQPASQNVDGMTPLCEAGSVLIQNSLSAASYMLYGDVSNEKDFHTVRPTLSREYTGEAKFVADRKGS
jgi:hypothetical protein